MAVARTIPHPDEGARCGHGEILVAPSTDPGWTPLFVRASAVAMETGGYLSHGAIAARESGLPAVVNIPDIFCYIRDGDTLLVDGARLRRSGISHARRTSELAITCVLGPSSASMSAYLPTCDGLNSLPKYPRITYEQHLL